ncbi:MAG: hypothetical protein IKW74_06625, partial [Thermoguttaceae bacterium]|nr:hypothetical protein [Thermoguttaceae bacterium]
SILQKFSSCDSASLFGISAAMESLETELITLEQQEQNQQKQLESIVRHPEILSCQDEWNRLNKQIQSVIETRETLPGLKVKRENQKRDFDQAVKTLGIPNPEKQLRDFVFSNQLKENLDRLKNEEETISDGLKLVTNDIKEKQRQQNEIRQKIQSQPEYLHDDSSVAIKNLLEETEVLLKQEPLLKHNSEQIKQLTDKLNEESRQEEKLRSILLQAIPEQRKDWDLSQVIPPFEAELNEFESQFQQLEKKVSEIDIKQEQYQLRGQEIMQQLEQLTIDSNVPDEKELQIARKNRDMLWDQLKSLITGISGQSIIELPGHISDKKKSENIEAISTSTPETGSGLNIFSATNVEEDSSPDTVPFIPLKVTRPEPVSETFNSLFMKDEIKQNLSLSSPSFSTNEKKPEDRIPEYESAVKRADTIIDIRFKNAQSIIQQKNFQAELRRCQDSVQQLEKEKQSLRITRDKLQIQWRSFCKTRNLPVETMSVALLKEWFKTRENWQRSIDQIHKINQEIDSVKDRLSDWESECHKIFKMFLSIVPSGTFDSEPDILAENRFSNKNEIPDTVCHLQKLFKKLNDWKEKLSARVQEHDAILLDYKKIEDDCQKSQRRLNEIIQQQSEWNKRRIEITTFLGFPEDWSTSNIDHCIKNIETLQRDQKDLAELSQQIELATDRLHRFAQQVNELGLLLGMESTPDVWPEAILSQLKTRFDEALEAETEFQSVRSKLSELQESIQIHKKQLSQKQKQNQELLTRYNLKTNNEFVKLGQTAEEYQKSKKELLSQEETLRLIFINQEKEYQHSLSLFAQTTKENLTETLYKLQQQRETCNDQINLLYSCEGTQKQSMTQLEQSEGAVSYLRKQEQLTGQFRDAVYQYIPRLFALKLLEASYIKYENEWQPEILERANSLFSKMTDGRYQHVRHSSGTDTFEVDDTKRGLIKKTNELSTATREQLYLAVRLAHILHYSHHAEPLPFVIDDILVNFDDHRKEITLNVLHELADQFQIIFLTCNQSTLTHFQKTFSDSTVLLL